MSAIVTALPFLLQGLLVTAEVSALTICVSLVLGLFGGAALLYGPPGVRVPIRLYVDAVRGLPVLVLIFGFYYGLPALGFRLPDFWTAVLALSLFKIGAVVETVRGALQSIPFGQHEAATALGLRFGQRVRLVIIPQALRRFLPPGLNVVTDTVKASALVSLVGVVDLMMAIQQIIGRTYRPMPLYLFGAAIYIAISFSLSTLSRRFDRRLARSE
jgi:polar amino acid transport system permease protein